MKKNLKIEEIKNNKSSSIAKLNDFLDELMANNPKKTNLISYWISDYINFLKFEDDFDPHKMKKYKSGEIVKVNLGFNVGSEMGGLHYAVVLSKKDTLSSPVITIVPLSSIKDTTEFNDWNVDLGTELHDLLNSKIEKSVPGLFDGLNSKEEIENASDEQMEKLINKLKETDKMVKELKKMKLGSYAAINQITTISKMRIYDPRTSSDTLSRLKLSKEKMDLIYKAIQKHYVK